MKNSTNNDGNKTMKISKIIYMSNLGVDTSLFHDAVVEAITTSSNLPAEIADLIDLKVVEVEDGIRGILNWA